MRYPPLSESDSKLLVSFCKKTLNNFCNSTITRSQLYHYLKTSGIEQPVAMDIIRKYLWLAALDKGYTISISVKLDSINNAIEFYEIKPNKDGLEDSEPVNIDRSKSDLRDIDGISNKLIKILLDANCFITTEVLVHYLNKSFPTCGISSAHIRQLVAHINKNNKAYDIESFQVEHKISKVGVAINSLSYAVYLKDQ